ncbi:MAG: hypothetical protein O6940_01895 [Ignavibacteria bacterium]|nr:hypothetical protein [Ignavibacteria bacterium]
MKKSAKPAILTVLILLLVATTLVLGNIGLRFKYEELVRKKVELDKKLKDQSTKKVNLIAGYQAVSSENKIVFIAESKLGMVRRTQPKIIVNVNIKLIAEVNEKLKAKYE